MKRIAAFVALIPLIAYSVGPPLYLMLSKGGTWCQQISATSTTCIYDSFNLRVDQWYPYEIIILTMCAAFLVWFLIKEGERQPS